MVEGRGVASRGNRKVLLHCVAEGCFSVALWGRQEAMASNTVIIIGQKTKHTLLLGGVWLGTSVRLVGRHAYDSKEDN